MNWLDKLAGRLGYAKSARRDFAAAASHRLTAGWNSVNTSANVDLYRGLDALRARSRDLCANNDYARRFLGMVGANVVGGAGVILQSRIYNAPGKPDDGANTAVEQSFARWGRRGACEVTGRLSWRDVQLLVIQTVARDGEALVRKIRGKSAGNAYGYSLQVLDIDRLDTKLVRKAEKGVNEIRMGVEVDAFGRAVAYWLRPYHPGDQWFAQGEVLSDHQRIPAADIIHVYKPDRPEQLRGAPWMHAAMVQLQNLGGYEEAAVIAARIGASKMGFFKNPDGEPPKDGEDAQGIPYTDAEPGAFGVLPNGYDFQPFNPDYPHAMYGDFVRACLRGVSSGLGVSYHALANDLTDVNFSSIRSGTLEERDQWISVQQWYIDAFLEPVFLDWLPSALAFGQITLANGSALPLDKSDKFAAHTWQARRWQWVDPLKDMEANVLAIQNGLKAPQDIAAELGVDYEDVLVKIKQAQDLAEKIGVKIGKPEPAPAPEPPPAEPSAAEKALGIIAARMAEPPAAPPAPTFHFKAGDVHVAPPAVTVSPPTVEVAAPEVRVDVAAPVVHVEPPAVEVQLEARMPEQPAPVVEVNVELPDEMKTTIVSMPARETSSTVERNIAGEITKTKQVEKDA